MSKETNNTPRYVSKRKNSSNMFNRNKLVEDLRQYKAPAIINAQTHSNVQVVSVELRPDTHPCNYVDWVDNGTPIVIHDIDKRQIWMSVECARATAKALIEAADTISKIDKDVKASFEALGLMGNENYNDDDEEDY